MARHHAALLLVGLARAARGQDMCTNTCVASDNTLCQDGGPRRESLGCPKSQAFGSGAVNPEAGAAFPGVRAPAGKASGRDS